MKYPGWKDELPVILELVDVGDGARMYAQIKGVAPENTKIGMCVKAIFEDKSDEYGTPEFQPL